MRLLQAGERLPKRLKNGEGDSEMAQRANVLATKLDSLTLISGTLIVGEWRLLQVVLELPHVCAVRVIIQTKAHINTSVYFKGQGLE